jgi:bifunctional non-homologous end joining protein LigD
VSLTEYKRKRDFKATPEPGPKVEKSSKHRFVVQKHYASHLHFDFRLEMDGVLKSWAVPKGPPLDPADKRLAMQVEDHPVSYFHFEGIIPEGNYGAGTVQVWDTGTWEPILPPGMKKKDADAYARQMLEKGDFKVRLKGKKINGEFVLAKMRSRRPGSKGTEWLLIKKQDEFVEPGYSALQEDQDWSVLTKRSLDEIRGDKKSKEWQSSRPAAVKRGSEWLRGVTPKKSAVVKKTAPVKSAMKSAPKKSSQKKTPGLALDKVKGAQKSAMPRNVTPMLATLVDEPFDSKDWFFEVKFDGYRALAYIEDGKVRYVSRNQNDMTDDFPELNDLHEHVRAKTAIVDGEICALDENGRPSFSLMQQRTGFEPGRAKKRTRNPEIAIVYYMFDVIYADGYSLMRVDLEKRKEILRELLAPNEDFRLSEAFPEKGRQLFEAAKQQQLEGIIAKRRTSCYVPKRSREWLKIKSTMRQECVIGGYTDPKGSREHFGSLVLGLYDENDKLVPVGQAGSGFTQKSHDEMWQRLKKLQADVNPFSRKPDASRGIHYVKPELVVEIKFVEWTHEGTGASKTTGLKMRAPVFQGLRKDKDPKECRFEIPHKAIAEKKKAESGAA